MNEKLLIDDEQQIKEITMPIYQLFLNHLFLVKTNFQLLQLCFSNSL